MILTAADLVSGPFSGLPVLDPCSSQASASAFVVFEASDDWKTEYFGVCRRSVDSC